MKGLYCILASVFFLQLGIACSEADRDLFEGPVGINFRIPKTSEEIKDYKLRDSSLIFREDTMVYSFAFDMVNTEREICVPVEVTGFAKEVDRKYYVEVVEYNGAKAGVHYDAVPTEHVLAAGKVKDSLRILFHRVDMDKQARKIGITIKRGGDFIEGVKEKLFVAVQVSDILEKPDWWDNWIGCFGTFHPVKYREWMKLYGGTGDLTGKRPDWWYAPLELTLILDLKRMFEENEFLDENGKRLLMPCTH